jgi:hypothetical protein
MVELCTISLIVKILINYKEVELSWYTSAIGVGTTYRCRDQTSHKFQESRWLPCRSEESWVTTLHLKAHAWPTYLVNGDLSHSTESTIWALPLSLWFPCHELFQAPRFRISKPILRQTLTSTSAQLNTAQEENYVSDHYASANQNQPGVHLRPFILFLRFRACLASLQSKTPRWSKFFLPKQSNSRVENSMKFLEP